MPNESMIRSYKRPSLPKNNWSISVDKAKRKEMAIDQLCFLSKRKRSKSMMANPVKCPSLIMTKYWWIKVKSLKLKKDQKSGWEIQWKPTDLKLNSCSRLSTQVSIAKTIPQKRTKAKSCNFRFLIILLCFKVLVAIWRCSIFVTCKIK